MSLTALHCPEQSTEADIACSPAPLTKANLRLLEDMTRSNKPSDETSANTPSNDDTGTSNNTKAKTISTTKTGFEDRLRANGVVHAMRSGFRPPKNTSEVRDYLDKSRSSASPTASQYEDYIETYFDGACEVDTVHLFTTKVLKEPTRELRKEGYKANRDKQWVDYPKDVGFNNNLSAPKPDYIEGYGRNTFPPTIQELGGAATLVKDSTVFPALPHLAVELKKTGGDMHLAERQAGFDGAAMLHARNKALNYLGHADVHGEASVVSASADGLYYNIYGHYTYVDEETGETKYYQCRLRKGTLDEIDDFKEGYKRLRNMQDWAREQSTDIRDRMNKNYNSRNFGSGRPSQSIASKTDGSYGKDVSIETKNPIPSLSANPPAPSQSSSSHRNDQTPSRSSNSSAEVDRQSVTNSSQMGPPARPISAPKAPSTSASVESDEHRDRYRDRRSYRDVDGIRPLQYRRSDSPSDKPRARQPDRRTLTRPDTAGSQYSNGSRSSAQSRSSDGDRSSASVSSKIMGRIGQRKSDADVKQKRRDGSAGPDPRPTTQRRSSEVIRPPTPAASRTSIQNSLQQPVDTKQMRQQGRGRQPSVDGQDQNDQALALATKESRGSSTPSASTSVSASSDRRGSVSSLQRKTTNSSAPKIPIAGGVAMKKCGIEGPVPKLKLKNREAGSK